MLATLRRRRDRRAQGATHRGMTTAPDRGTRGRLDAAFAAEERRGLMVASAARSAAAAVVLVWLAAANPERGFGLAWVLGTGAVFLVTGLAQFWLYARGSAPTTAPYVFVLIDSLVLATVLL